MRIMALYNTRGMVDPLIKLRNRHVEECDLFIHLGNCMLNSTNDALSGYLVLEGDNDHENQFLKDFNLNLSSINLLFLGKNKLEFLFFNNKKEFKKYINNVRIIITPFKNKKYFGVLDGVLYISPGDLNVCNSIQTYSIIDVDQNMLILNIIEYTSSDIIHKVTIKI